jgi:hypothetical protein
MRRNRWRWLILALVLLGLGLGLMKLSQEEPPPPPRKVVKMSRGMQAQDWERQVRRRVPPPSDAGVVRPRHPDPVIGALPRGEGRTAVIIEANAIRHSPLGELMLDCLLTQPGRRENLERLRQDLGWDPLEATDRVAVMDDGFLVSGHFSEAQLDSMLGGSAESSAYGEQGRVYAPASGSATGAWGDSILVVAETPEKVRQILDRIEGRGTPPSGSVITEEMTYGDVYGVVSVEQWVQMLPPEQQALGERMRQMTRRAELHLDVSSDFVLQAYLTGPDRQPVTDLAKTLGAALSVARMQAMSQGETELAQFLEYAGVMEMAGKLRLELAVPLDVIRRELAWGRGGLDGGW